MPLLPYEELLCKEAMLLFENPIDLSCNDSDSGGKVLLNQHCVKASFVNLMRFHHRARWWLMKLGAQACYSSKFPTIILCNICKRDCYVAYVMCSCYNNPICLHHGIILHVTLLFFFIFDSFIMVLFLICVVESEIRSCQCRSSRTIFLSSDLLEFETVAKKFEQDVGIKELEKQLQENGFNSSLTNVFVCHDEDGYRPYCEIQFEEGIKCDTEPTSGSTFPAPKECFTLNKVRLSFFLCFTN